MRKPAQSLTAIFIMLTLLMSGCADRVTFPDQDLLRAVAGAVGAAPDSLTVRDVRRITSLDASGCGIASLEGIESLQSLTTLVLDDNSIGDLQPLVDARLPSLTSVSVMGNPLSVDLDSRVYQQVALLADKGVRVAWLPTFITPVGRHGILKQLDQAEDGAIIAIGDGSLIRVTLQGSVSHYECPWYPGLRSIVRLDGLVLSNNTPTAQTAPWEYSFVIPQGFTSKRLLDYPAGDYRMVQLADTTRLLIGSPYGAAGAGASALVARLNADGSEAWSIAVDGFGGGRSAVCMHEDFAVLCDRGLAKISTDGKTVVATELPTDYAYRVTWLERIVKTDDGCMVLGVPDSDGASAVVLTYTSDLVLVGNTTVSLDTGSGRARVFGFARTNDGGLVITIHNWSYPEEEARGRLLKLEPQGKVAWSRPYDQFALDEVIQTADGGFVVTARGEELVTYIIKTDPNGLVGIVSIDSQ